MKTIIRSLRNRTTRSCPSAHFVKRLSSWLALATALTVVPSDAADYTWDISGAAGITGGGGTWDFATSNWTLDGGATNTIWANNNTALFSGASGAVVLAGPVTAQGLTFSSNGYDISGSTITLASPAELSAYLGEFATINSKLSGTDGLTQTRGGSIRLANSTNDYTGSTTISGGSLIITAESSLGASASDIVVTGSASRGTLGGGLVLDGLGGSIAMTRGLSLQGQGAIGDRSAALATYGTNTLAAVTMGVGNVSTRILANGTLNLAGTLTAAGTALTTVDILGGVNQAGANIYNLTGPLVGTGILEKSGSGTLRLNTSDSTGFTGSVRVSSSATGVQSETRITSAGVLGTRAAAGTGSVLDMNGGILAVLMETPSVLSGGSPANVYGRASSTFVADNAPSGGQAVNGTVALGAMLFEDNLTLTFNSRNGYGVSFGATTVNGGDNSSTFTNNLSGLLTITGNFWNNNNTTGDRVMNIGGNGNTLIDGNLLGQGGATFDRDLSKTGSGVLTITGTGSTLDGTVSVQGSLRITDFNSIGTSNTSAITLGSATTTAGNLIIGTSATPTATGLTTSRDIVLNGTTNSNSIIANQTGLDPVILNGVITRPVATGGTVILGGTSTAANAINTAIPNATGTNVGTLRKEGAGTWVLAAANAYTGLTTITNGTLRLRANAGASTILPSANAITFGTVNNYAGSALELEGVVDTATTQNLGAFTVSNGANTIRLVPVGTGTANLVFASGGVPATGSALNIVGSNASNTVTITGAATGLFSTRAYVGGNNFAYSAAGVLRAPVYDGVTDGATFVTVAGGATVGAGQNNFNITGDITAQTSSTVGTLRFDGARTLTLAAAQTLTVRTGAAGTSGGILATGGNSLITGGTSLTTGGSGPLDIAVDNGSELQINSLMTGFSGGVTKNGLGKLILGAANAQTGTFTINEGEVELGTGGRLGASNVALTIRQGATLDLNGVSPTTQTGSFNNNGIVTSATPATFTIAPTAAGTSFGSISGAISLVKNGTGAQTWNGLSSYTGSTTIGSTALVTVDLLANSGFDSAIGKGSTTAATDLVFTTTGAGGLVYAGNVRDGNLVLGSASSTTDRLFTLSGTALTLSSTASNNNSVVFSNTGDVDYGGSATTKLITLTGTSQGDNTLNARIQDNGTNVVTVTKTGTGIWVLGGGLTGNTYSGATTITQGILRASDGAGLSANSNLVFDGGIVQGSGTLNRSLGTAAGEMQFLAAAVNTAQFSGGFAAGGNKLTVTFGSTVNPIWGSTAGFVDVRDGLILQSSQARGQGATASVALSEVEIASGFSLGTASAPANAGLTFIVAQNNATVTGLASTAGFVVGQSFTGTNIPSGAYIVSINSATSLTLSANTANVGGTAGTFADGATIANSLRAIRVDDNGNAGSDFATISGDISAGDAVTGLRKVGAGILKLTGSNSYQGETNVNQGTLSVVTLGNTAAPGNTSVGLTSNTTAGAVTLGNGGTGGGILQYNGAGETSDRMIRLNSTTGSNQIHADGTGALILKNVDNTMTAGAKTLFLRGTNTAGNMITNVLADNGGALGVTVDGGATWLLTNTGNTYTGNTTVGGGALGITSEATLGTSQLVLSNGNLFASGGDLTFATQNVQLATNTNAAVTGDYSITLTNALDLRASANNVGLNNGIADGELLTLNAGATANFMTAARTWTIGGPGDTIINGAITTTTTFALNLTYSGADGTLTLNGADNDNTALFGTNTLSGGTLILNKLGAFGTTASTFSFGSGILQATSDANGMIDTAAVTLSGNGTVSGTSTIELKGPVTNSAANRIVTNNITGVGKTFLISGQVNLSENTTARILTVQGTGDTIITGAILGSSGVGTQASVLTKRGTGTLTLSNMGNLYGGGTVIDGGTVLLGAADVIPNAGTVTIRQLIGETTAGSLDLNGFSDTIAALTLGATATNATNAAQAPSVVNTGAPGAILTLGGTVTYNAGTASFENGTAVISANIALGAATRTFTVNNSTVAVDLLVSGNISNPTTARGLTKAGLGVLELSGTNTYTGATTINAGTLLVTGSISGSTATVNTGGTLGGTGTTGAVIVAGSGVVSPGSSPGTLNTGNYNMSVTTTTLKLEISAPTAGNFDQLNVTGSVTLGGSADISLFAGYTAAINDTFLVILNDGGDAVSGTFLNDVGGFITGSDSSLWAVDYAAGDGNDVELMLIPEPSSFAMLAASLGMAVGLQRFRRRNARQY